MCSDPGAGTSGASFTLENCTIRNNLGWGVERIGDPSAIQDSQISSAKTTISDNALGGFHIQAAVATIVFQYIRRQHWLRHVRGRPADSDVQ